MPVGADVSAPDPIDAGGAAGGRGARLPACVATSSHPALCCLNFVSLSPSALYLPSCHSPCLVTPALASDSSGLPPSERSYLLRIFRHALLFDYSVGERAPPWHARYVVQHAAVASDGVSLCAARSQEAAAGGDAGVQPGGGAEAQDGGAAPVGGLVVTAHQPGAVATFDVLSAAWRFVVSGYLCSGTCAVHVLPLGNRHCDLRIFLGDEARRGGSRDQHQVCCPNRRSCPSVLPQYHV